MNELKKNKSKAINVQPIKDSNVLNDVKDVLKNNFKYGQRNYTIFQVGKATLLRVSDVLNLKYSDVFQSDGTIHKRVISKDKKTGKRNTLYLDPIKDDLEIYKKWLDDNQIVSEWLFPSSNNHSKPISPKHYYKVMHKTGELLGITYLGTHTMRKTGAYRVYEQSNYNIAFVMDLLNHSSQKSTLKYLGIDQQQKETMLNKIDFG